MSNYTDFINVGFGEATFVKLKKKYGDDYNLLIDAGDFQEGVYQKDNRRKRLEDYLEENNITNIDTVILTHFHKDHIGRLIKIIDKIVISRIILNIDLPEKILDSNFEIYDNPMYSSLTVYKKILNKCVEKNIKIIKVDKKYSLMIDNYSVEILPPKKEILEDINKELLSLNMKKLEVEIERVKKIDKILNSSSLSVLIKKDNKNLVLITSDSPLEFWNDYKTIIKNTKTLQSPHHGDIKYVSKELLQLINMEYFIVSADSENTYGLPNDDISEFVSKNSKAKVYFTEAKDTKHSVIRYNFDKESIKLI